MSQLCWHRGATDENYLNIRDGAEERSELAREEIERMWGMVSLYLDADSSQKATRDFIPVYWEMLLAYAIKSSGKNLVERARLRYRNNRGPDLFAEDYPGIWIEAVVVGPGTGPDAVKLPEKMKVYDYNPDPVVLRLRSVIRDKSKKFKSYFEDGIVSQGQATVIAISGVKLPHGFRVRRVGPPSIVRAVYPVNNLVIEVDRETKSVTDSHVQFRDRLVKKSGEEVTTDIFLDPSFSNISAVLFSGSDWNFPAIKPGNDFILVHNSMAATPLPDGWFIGDEYWWHYGENNWSVESRRNEPE